MEMNYALDSSTTHEEETMRDIYVSANTQHREKMELLCARTARSPSVIPEPVSFTTALPSESRMEVRPYPAYSLDHKTPSQARESGPALASRSVPQDVRLEPELGVMQFIIPLPLASRIRDQYHRVLSSKSSVLQELGSQVKPDHKLIASVQEAFGELNDVATHIDLNHEDPLLDSPNEDYITWAVNCSSKFSFLRELLEHLRNHALSIAVFAKQGPLQLILHQFLKSMHIAEHGDQNNTATRVVVIPTRSTEPVRSFRADLILGFDESALAHDAGVIALRRQTDSLSPIPFISLVVFASAEHIFRSMPSALSDVQRLKSMAICITQLRSKVGHLDESCFSTQEVAEATAKFVLAGPSQATWPVPKIQSLHLEELDVNWPAGHPDELLHDETVIDPEQDDNDTKISRLGLKRKRLHTTVEAGENQRNGTKEKQDDGGLNSAATKLKTLQRDHDALITSSNLTLAAYQEEVFTSRQTLEDLQGKYERLNRAYHGLKMDLTARNEELSEARLVQTRMREKIELSKKAKREQDEHLSTMRKENQASPNELLSKLANLQEQLDTSDREKTASERRLNAAKEELIYMRDRYQSLDLVATEATREISSLTAERDHWRTLAVRGIIQTRELNNTSETAAYVQQLEIYKREIGSLKELLRRRPKLRSGMTMRSSSQAPKSPGPGVESPTRSRPTSRGPPGSRGTSPFRGQMGARRTRAPKLDP